MNLTLSQLEKILAEKKEDLRVFTQALDLMRERVQVSQDTPSLMIPLHSWAGATGLVDVTSVMVNHMARVVEELERQVTEARSAAPERKLRLVGEKVDE